MFSNNNNSAYSRKSDEVYQVICRAINIDDKREQYTKVYDFVKLKIVNGLKNDIYFKTLSCGIKLCGSYADNLKISKPNEFDLILHLEFLYNNYVIIHKDTSNHGNVFIDLTNVLAHLSKNKNDDMHKFLKKFVNTSNYFCLDKFQQWLQGRITKVLNEIECKVYYSGRTYKLKYRKQGPAHTIEVNDDDGLINFAIDFVPGFRFEANKAISERKPTKFWEAIPKPMNGSRTNTSFRTSYTESERDMIHNRNQFKNTLRLMKKFRDMQPKLKNLKSYYIKTIFLWHFEETPQDFWNSSITYIVHVMFEKLEEALFKKELKYFWDDNLNLLEKPFQVDSMYHEVRIARKTLESATCSHQNILDIFLLKYEQTRMPEENQEFIQRSLMDQPKPVTQQAQTKMPEEDQKFIQTSFIDQAKPVCMVVSGILAVAALATGIYSLFKNSNDDKQRRPRRRDQGL